MNHKKVKPPQARAHCSMCKPWKDGRITHDSVDFESHSAHVARTGLAEAVEDHLAGSTVECGDHPACFAGGCPASCAGNGNDE